MVLSLTNQSLKNKKKTPSLEGVFFSLIKGSKNLSVKLIYNITNKNTEDLYKYLLIMVGSIIIRV